MSDSKKTKTPLEAGLTYECEEGILMVYGAKEVLMDTPDEQEDEEEDEDGLSDEDRVRMGLKPKNKSSSNREVVFMSGNMIISLDDIDMASDVSMLHNKEWVKISKVESVTMGEFYIFITIEDLYKLKVKYAKDQSKRFQTANTEPTLSN